MSDTSWLGLVGAPQIQDDGVDVEERRRVLNFVGCTIVDNPDEERTDITPPGASAYTDENAQDAVGTILVDSATIDFTYSDSTPSITASVIDDSITPAKLANVSTNTIRGRVTAGTGDVENLTTAQATTLIDPATGALKGAMSAAHYTLVNNATATATASTIAKWDSNKFFSADRFINNGGIWQSGADAYYDVPTGTEHHFRVNEVDVCVVEGTGIALFNATVGSYGGGTGVLAMKNAATAPTTAVSNEALYYVEGGIPKCLDANGVIREL